MIYVMDSIFFVNIVKIILLELYVLKYMILYLGKKLIYKRNLKILIFKLMCYFYV